MTFGVSSSVKVARTFDLLDANESTWAFAMTDCVGGKEKTHVTWLETFALDAGC